MARVVSLVLCYWMIIEKQKLNRRILLVALVQEVACGRIFQRAVGRKRALTGTVGRKRALTVLHCFLLCG